MNRSAVAHQPKGARGSPPDGGPVINLNAQVQDEAQLSAPPLCMLRRSNTVRLQPRSLGPTGNRR